MRGERFTNTIQDRMQGNIEVPRLSSSRSAFSLVHRASKLWNKLSKDIKDNGKSSGYCPSHVNPKSIRFFIP